MRDTRRLLIGAILAVTTINIVVTVNLKADEPVIGSICLRA
jgi:hypothetical protein